MKITRTSTANRRAVSLLLISLIFTSLFQLPVFAAEAADVPAAANVVAAANVTATRDYFDEAAADLKDRGIFKGYEDGSMGENNLVTRAEMAAICTRLIGLPDGWEDEYTSEKTYTDMPSDHWATAYIGKAFEMKIAQGDPDGKFRPSDNVKMNEAVKMIVSAGGYGSDSEGNPLEYPDGYMDRADLLAMTDNVSCEGESAVSRGAVIVMVYEMIHSGGIFGEVTAAGDFGNLPGNTAAGGRYALSGDFVYYANSTDNYNLYKAAPDFSAPKKILYAGVDNISVIGDTVYCVEEGSKLISVKTDGGNRKVLREGYFVRVYIKGDTAFFWETVGYTQYISTMKTDGTGYRRLYKMDCGVICQHGCGHEVQMNGTRIYFREDDGLKSMDYSGGDVKVFPIRSHPDFHINETNLYIYDHDGDNRGIAKYDLAGNKITTYGDLYVSIHNITDEYLYYIESAFYTGIETVKRMALLDNSVQIVTEMSGDAQFFAYIDIAGDYVVITEGKMEASADYDETCEHFDCDCYVYPLTSRLVKVTDLTNEAYGR
jgi:S-layer homology domain.